jgi:hypothetical protein
MEQPAEGIVLVPLAADRVRVENRGSADAWLLPPGVHVWASLTCVGWMSPSADPQPDELVRLAAGATLEQVVTPSADWPPPYRVSVYVFDDPGAYAAREEARIAWAELP